MTKEPPGGSKSAVEGVCAFLASFGIGRTSAIHLVGGGALASLMWLCRHGYEEVAILSGPCTPSEPADLLLALDGSGASTLAGLAGDMAHVRPGGVVIVRTDRRHHVEREQARRLLRGHGFRIERRLQNGRSDVFVARRALSAAAAGR